MKNHYFVGCDLGLVRDKSVVCTVHRENDGLIYLDNMMTFEGSKDSPVVLEDVFDHILNLCWDFRVRKVVFDPWNSASLTQRLRERNIPIEEFNFSGQNLTRLTQNLFSLFREERIKIFDYPQLIDELKRINIVEKPYGYRLDHESGQHDDHVIALGMASLYAIQEFSRQIEMGTPDEHTLDLELERPLSILGRYDVDWFSL